MNTLIGRDPKRVQTPTHVCQCLHQGDIFAQIYRCVHIHRPAFILIKAHKHCLTTMRMHMDPSDTDTALWICVALLDINKKKKLSPWIRGITSKPTTAERINNTEQDL